MGWPFRDAREVHHIATVPRGATPDSGGGSVVVRDDVHLAIHALVIGIDKYECPAIENLLGAVSDADAIYNYLRNDLHVPKNRIVNLRNEEATRAAIIREIKALGTRNGICKDDPVLIYFAGHGTTAMAPAEWGSGHGKVSLIVPYDADRELRNPETSRYAIPDRTIGALLHNLAEAAGGCGIGNNITVIFDCCHSGSGTRDLSPLPFSDSRRPRGFMLGGVLPATLDEDIMREASGTRAICVPDGFTYSGARSHVLLAACSENESAFENEGRGYFTQELLRTLRAVKPREITYRELMRRIVDIPGQTPQCEGYYADRMLFNTRVSRRCRIYRLKRLGRGEFTVFAGVVNGMTEGTRFAAYMDRNFKPGARPVATLIVTKVHAFASVLIYDKCSSQLDGNSPCFAVSGDLEGIATALYSFVSSARRDHRSIPDAFKDLAYTPSASARNSAYGSAGAQAVASIVKEVVQDLVTGGGDLLAEVEASGKHPALGAAARFLRRMSPAAEKTPLRSKVEIQVFQLEPESWTDLEEGWRWPLKAQGSNLFDSQSGSVSVVADGTPYGILLRNDSTVPLHVWAFYSDETIDMFEFYRPPSIESNADGVLPGKCIHHQECGHAQNEGETKGEVAIGYGGGGGQPCQFILPHDQDHGVGYIKFVFSTRPIDLSDIEQDSPTRPSATRAITPKKDDLTMYDTVTITVAQHRGRP